AKFVVVKNPMNYRIAYADVAKAAIILDTPGPTPATTRHLPYQRVNRPSFPLDLDVTELVPTVYTRISPCHHHSVSSL
ncbi:MAG: MlrC C-terminal domain-containing protein, partial [Phycisphaeraceae bacterium]|nr:MlrC C-terminal domain-containing protein [Phycisphaeraceae bacterium]